MSGVEVPVWEKVNLSVQEAAGLLNIGEKTLRSLVKEPDDYTLVIGSKVLIKRHKFEHWLSRPQRLHL